MLVSIKTGTLKRELRNKAFEWLEKVYQQRGKMLQPLTLDWRFASLHSDPRFIDLRRRVGLPHENIKR
ncbi:MAG: hypothetical protein HY650_02825 [Acidobacteria bacterium]|nr:hypothetical protein [Acidobacteriota bacterium]